MTMQEHATEYHSYYQYRHPGKPIYPYTSTPIIPRNDHEVLLLYIN